MAFSQEMSLLQQELEQMDFAVFTPEITENDAISSDTSHTFNELTHLKNGFIDTHVEKIRRSDAILVANYTKHDIVGYVGANAFLEIGFAYVFRKKIFLLHELPEQPNKLEIAGMFPKIIHGNLHIISEHFIRG